jgi:hypothetical protein
MRTVNTLGGGVLTVGVLVSPALAQSPSAWNGLSERFGIDTGNFGLNAHNVLSFNGDNVDFERDLGLEESVDTFWVDATWRVGRRHQLKLSYTRFAFFGHRPAIDVTTASLERYQRERLDKGKAPATVNHEVHALRRAFNVAARRTPPLFPKYLGQEGVGSSGRIRTYLPSRNRRQASSHASARAKDSGPRSIGARLLRSASRRRLSTLFRSRRTWPRPSWIPASKATSPSSRAESRRAMLSSA